MRVMTFGARVGPNVPDVLYMIEPVYHVNRSWCSPPIGYRVDRDDARDGSVETIARFGSFAEALAYVNQIADIDPREV